MRRTKIIASETAIREYLSSIIFESGAGWKEAAEEDFKPVTANAVVDPSAAVTDPSNEKFVPRNRQEFKIAMASLIDDLDDTMAPEVYDAAKKAIKHASEDKDEEDMKKDTKVEESIRLSVRKILRDAAALSEAAPPAPPPGFPEMSPEEKAQQRQTTKTVGELPPVKKIPLNMSTIHKVATEKDKQDLRNTLTKMKLEDDVDNPTKDATDLASMESKERARLGLPTAEDVTKYWEVYDSVFQFIVSNAEEDEEEDQKLSSKELEDLYRMIPETETFQKDFKAAFGKPFMSYMEPVGRNLLKVLTEGKNLSIGRDFGMAKPATIAPVAKKPLTTDEPADSSSEQPTSTPDTVSMAASDIGATRAQVSAALGYESVSTYTKDEFIMLARWFMDIARDYVKDLAAMKTESVMNTLRGRHLVKSYVNNLLKENNISLNEAQFLLANPRHIIRLKSFRKLLG